ncbi:single-stranded-DNA-specific exonuclease RecJ [bacterium]
MKTPNQLETIQKLSESLSISEIIAKIIVKRGFSDHLETKKFLYPNLFNMHNPFLLPDIPKAISRIKKAIKNQEKIMIFGDKDVDGQTSTILFVEILKRYSAHVDYYVPETGYGLDETNIQKIIDNKIDLLITVDAGIRNIVEVEKLNEHGIDVIITDHHEPEDELPNAIAVVDQKRIDSVYPFKELAGCAVVFKIGQALDFSYNIFYDKEIVICMLDDEDKIIGVKLKNGIITDEFKIVQDYEVNAHFKKAYKVLIINFKKFKSIFDAKIEFTSNVKDFFDFIKAVNDFDNDSLEYYFEIFDIVLKGEKTNSKLKSICELYSKILLNCNNRFRKYFDDFCELVCMGTVADIMPLIDENRIFVKYGIEGLKKHPNNKGLRMLIDKFLAQVPDFTAKDIAWNVIPKLNAAGRMDKPEVGLNVLMSKSGLQIADSIEKLAKLNEERRTIQEISYQVAEDIINKNKNDKFIFAADKRINKGVTGLVANMFLRKSNLPSIVISIEGDECTGSVRSSNGLNVVELLNASDNLLVKHGGHKQAGGFTVEYKNLEVFKKSVVQFIDQVEPLESIDNEFDLELSNKNLTYDMIAELELLEPFGQGNAFPVFKIVDPKFSNAKVIGSKNNHLKAYQIINNTYVDFVGWDMAHFFDDFMNNGLKEIYVRLGKNTFNFMTKWQFEIKLGK